MIRRHSGPRSRQRCIVMTNFNYDTFHTTVNYADFKCQKLIYFIKRISDHLLLTRKFSSFQDGKSIEKSSRALTVKLSSIAYSLVCLLQTIGTELAES
jgi:hypothetical protein